MAWPGKAMVYSIVSHDREREREGERERERYIYIYICVCAFFRALQVALFGVSPDTSINRGSPRVPPTGLDKWQFKSPKHKVYVPEFSMIFGMEFLNRHVSCA